MTQQQIKKYMRNAASVLLETTIKVGIVLEEVKRAIKKPIYSTGNERDKLTGWDYRNARYYDSDIGRFLGEYYSK
jgi:hypothetical protein